MKKKILSLCLVIALIAVAVVGSTLAYFTDTDSAVNVFTMGNVDIELHEDNGIADTEADYKADAAYRKWLKNDHLLTPSVPVEKDVWVKNIGKNPAVIRVSILVPVDLDPMLTLTWDNVNTNDDGWTLLEEDVAVDYDGDGANDYIGYCYMYNSALASSAITPDVLTTVTLKDAVTCKTLPSGDIYYELVEGTDTYSMTTDSAGLANFVIYAEAGQHEGYTNGTKWDSIETSLNAMFGAPFSNMKIDIPVASQEELNSALAAAAPGTIITLTSDFNGVADINTAADVVFTDNGSGVTGFTFGAGSEGGSYTIEGFDGLVIPGTGYADSSIKVNSAVTVTIDGCVFDQGNGKYNNAIHASADAEIYVTNTIVDGVRAFWTSNSVPAVLSFENCTFKNIDNWVIQHNTTPCDVDITVNNCVFDNCTDGIMKVNSNDNGQISAGHTFTFTNNTLTNIAGHGNSEAKMFAVNTVDLGATAVWANNTRDGAVWTPDASNGLNIW